jgi:hypothetical protein
MVLNEEKITKTDFKMLFSTRNQVLHGSETQQNQIEQGLKPHAIKSCRV